MRIKGPSNLKGEPSIPGDKSISHRIAITSSIAEGASRVEGFSASADCQATLDCIERLGIRIDREPQQLIIHGRGLFGFKPLQTPISLNAHNSGSTMRILTGILAGQSFGSEIDGDASLRSRPMARIVEPLSRMGARIEASPGNKPPLRIQGNRLKAIEYRSPVASAQVKSCVLLAGLLADGRTTFTEPSQSRDHTELMLKEFGAPIARDTINSWTVKGGAKLTAVDYHVPGDVSSAAFLLAGAVAASDSEVTLRGVGLNPTRTAFLDVLSQLGANVIISNKRVRHSEAVGDLRASTSELRTPSGTLVLSGAVIANIIDEIPILAVLATRVDGTIEVRDARELRVKESDRIRTIVDGIESMGGRIQELDDGFRISGPQRLTGSVVESNGDHRIAMAFAVAAFLADGTTEIRDADCASVSFPGFYKELASLSTTARFEAV
jgi:3-phosphoshikimate 1-carboxyvinyltransferase